MASGFANVHTHECVLPLPFLSAHDMKISIMNRVAFYNETSLAKEIKSLSAYALNNFHITGFPVHIPTPLHVCFLFCFNMNLNKSVRTPSPRF